MSSWLHSRLGVLLQFECNSPEIRGTPLYGKFGNGATFLAPAEKIYSSSCCHGGMATAAWLLRIPPANDTKHERPGGYLWL
jgi:hypothetical protein